MVRTTLPIWWVALSLKDDTGFQVGDTHNGVVEVVNLEPQKHAVSVGFVVRIADRAVMMLDVESVQLKNQHTVRYQTLVLFAAVRALASEETLIPAAARFDIGHCD